MKQVIERILDVSLSLKEVRDLTVAQIQQMARGGTTAKQETAVDTAPEKVPAESSEKPQATQ